MPTSKPLRAWLRGSGAEEIVVDPRGGWNEPSRRAAAILRADPAELAAGWAARVERGDGESVELWRRADASAVAAIAEALAAEEATTEPGLHSALGRAHGDGDLVYTASSMPIRDQEAFLPSGPADVSFLCNRGANGIDGLVSSGIGAAVASARPTTIVTGDLGLLHDLGGLAALPAAEVPVRVVVIDNDGGGIFHFLPQHGSLDSEEFEALLGTPRGVDVSAAAAMFGLPHRRLDSFADLPDALAAGSGLVEVRVDRDANVALHGGIAEGVGSALAALRLRE
jgi:2-succinyl-5-enolpyruvyl-6-hydroxy-3-cyclohexene-1-carboxylate synthase